MRPTVLHVDPDTCRPWEGRPRPDAALTPETCADLIASIRETGQIVPAIARALPPGGAAAYEIVCGARRLLAARHLAAEGSDTGLLVDLRDIDDAEAFRLADLENRARTDISDLARARSYAAALARHFDGVQRHMARALGVGEAWLSRHLVLARLPETLVAAFTSPDDIRESHARAISRLLADPAALPRLEAEAARLAAERADGASPKAAKVLGRLRAALSAAPAPRRAPVHREFRRAPHDKPVVLRRRGDVVTLSFDADISREALRGALSRVVFLGWR